MSPQYIKKKFWFLIFLAWAQIRGHLLCEAAFSHSTVWVHLAPQYLYVTLTILGLAWEILLYSTSLSTQRSPGRPRVLSLQLPLSGTPGKSTSCQLCPLLPPVWPERASFVSVRTCLLCLLAWAPHLGFWFSLLFAWQFNPAFETLFDSWQPFNRQSLHSLSNWN